MLEHKKCSIASIQLSKIKLVIDSFCVSNSYTRDPRITSVKLSIRAKNRLMLFFVCIRFHRMDRMNKVPTMWHTQIYTYVNLMTTCIETVAHFIWTELPCGIFHYKNDTNTDRASERMGERESESEKNRISKYALILFNSIFALNNIHVTQRHVEIQP